MSTTPTIPIIRLFDCLIISIQVDLSDVLIEQLTQQITATIERTTVFGLILDFSGTDVMDSHISRRMRDLAMTARLMGVDTVVCGLRASIVITLVEMGLGMPGVRSALNLERALEILLAREHALAPNDEAPAAPLERVNEKERHVT